MIRRLFFALGAVAFSAMAAIPSRAEEPATAPAITSAEAPSAEKPAASPAAEPSPENSSELLGEEPSGLEKPASMSAAPQAAEDWTKDPPVTIGGAEKTVEDPDEAAAPAPASREAAETKPEAEPSPAEEPAASQSMAAQPAEPAVASKPVEEPSPKTQNTPAAAPAEAVAAKPVDEPSPKTQNIPAAAPAETVAAKPVDEPSPKTTAAPAEAEALRNALSSLPAGASDEERNERAALMSFYESRGYAPLWTAFGAGYTPKASTLEAEIKRSKDWGLDPRDFPLPAGLGAESAAAQSPQDLAAAEMKISLAALKYGRYARGGRIINPSEQLSSYLDRRPQLMKPQAILDGLAAADQVDAYLRGLHPKHPQFERLRQKYLALAPRKRESAEARRLLANMEEWRWMPEDMGDVYVWNNIPEYTQRVMKDGLVVRKEAIVTGQMDKQTPIFSRQLRKITFKPTWIVPDSIKVRELLPNLIRGGSLMREWGLEVLRDGEPINWRKVDWSATDIRNFEVIQPNGPKSVMGKVKFSFPSQHTVFMHDALERDKWMFRVSKRTYSHGCMRVQNPIGLAEIILREDKGWDTAKTRESLNKGGNNNEIPIEHKVMVHMTYFTALVDDDGKLHTFPDVYGHERRITLALEGKWSQIVKGRDHLAPVELNEANVHHRYYPDDEAYEQTMPRHGYPSATSRNTFLDSLFGGGGGYEQYPTAPRPYQYR
jgi:murein L,D-transpeptidase YcbB/YkuD